MSCQTTSFRSTEIQVFPQPWKPVCRAQGKGHSTTFLESTVIGVNLSLTNRDNSKIFETVGWSEILLMLESKSPILLALSLELGAVAMLKNSLRPSAYSKQGSLPRLLLR